MTRDEAIAVLQEEIDGNLELTIREWRERDEQRLFPALRMAIEALSEPKWNCTANFTAEQLDRLRNMTDEERWDFLIRFFSPSAEVVHKPDYSYEADMVKRLRQANDVPIVYCMDCAKSEPLDEHGALWKCKAHDRTTLRHSYCSHGEMRGPSK